jgi:phosphoribosyl-AMP cyclohydrolase / phosphoribosyl-ATP pyrophosphohydrolase
MIEQLNFNKMNGLIPVAVQDADTGALLMIGFMNENALKRTIEEQQVVFWSRTKQRLWKKGETSGNYLDIVSVQPDCDSDSLLVLARPRGPVCHTGQESCFGEDRRSSFGKILDKLSLIIRDRSNKKPPDSYTSKLLSEGAARIGQKVGEEAVELAIAAQYTDKKRCVEESADLLYHLLVLLEAKGIDVVDVGKELERRMIK